MLSELVKYLLTPSLDYGIIITWAGRRGWPAKSYYYGTFAVKNNVDELSDLVANRIKGSPTGSISVFVPMGESEGLNWGLKLFESRKNRDRVFAIQKKFEAHGFAPKLGEKVELSHGNMRYGYMTEQIELVVPYEISQSFKNDPEGYFQYLIDEVDPKYPEEIMGQKVDYMAEITGIYLLDMHEENWGLKNGELMPLDFGAYRDENEKYHYHTS